MFLHYECKDQCVVLQTWKTIQNTSNHNIQYHTTIPYHPPNIHTTYTNNAIEKKNATINCCSNYSCIHKETCEMVAID